MANEPTTPALVNSALVNPTTNNRPTLDFRIPRSPLPPLNPPPLIRRHTISTTLPISGPHRPLTPHHISFYTLAPNTKNRTALWASARSKWHAEVNTASVRVCSPLSDMTTQAEAYRQDQANLRALRVWGGRVHAISPGGGGRRKRHQKVHIFPHSSVVDWY